jgi:hypothetical protein
VRTCNMSTALQRLALPVAPIQAPLVRRQQVTSKLKVASAQV